MSMVMKVTAVAEGETYSHKCECEHGKCVHPKRNKPCVYWALTMVYFAGAGSFWLCDACINNYMADGFDLVP